MNNEQFINNLQTQQKKDNNKAHVSVEIIDGVSKKGKAYQCLQLTIGEYETRIFPTKFEMKYIQGVL